MNTRQSNEEKKDAPDIETLSAVRFGQQILLGALVADSIAMPVHWYYNQSAIERDFGLIDTYHPKKHTLTAFSGDLNTSRSTQMVIFCASSRSTGGNVAYTTTNF